MTSDAIATALREGLKQVFTEWECELHEASVSALTPVVERLLRDRDGIIELLDRSCDAANTRAAEAERRLREVREYLEEENLKAEIEVSHRSTRHQYVADFVIKAVEANAYKRAAKAMLTKVLALLDTGAGQGEK